MHTCPIGNVISSKFRLVYINLFPINHWFQMVLIVLIVVAVVAAIIGAVVILSVVLKTRNDKRNDWRQLAKDLKGNGDDLSPRDLSNIYVKYNNKLTIPLFLGFAAGKSTLQSQKKLPNKYSHLVNLLLNSPTYDELNKIKEGETIQVIFLLFSCLFIQFSHFKIP